MNLIFPGGGWLGRAASCLGQMPLMRDEPSGARGKPSARVNQSAG
ncbi:hypothetical protein ACFOVT_05040 [Novosphingobium lubricantis]